MKKISGILIFLLVQTVCFAQSADDVISEKEVLRIESALASDDMQGRKPFTPSIDKAADFIATEFKKSGLKFFPGLTDYRQPFSLLKAKMVSAKATWDGNPVNDKNIVAISTEKSLDINERSGYTVSRIDSGKNLMMEAYKILQEEKNHIITVPSVYGKDFQKLNRFNRESFKTEYNVIFVLADTKAAAFQFTITNDIENKMLTNVVGVLPGKSKKDEYVLFSGHYDHLGIGKPNAAMDSIYNGANDDAAGTTAVIMLANYFSKLKNNERSIIFVAFTAEELGGFGSQHFSKQLEPEKVVAMFNIEMIGTESKWGTNSAYITGYEKSDFGKILQKNLTGSDFHFEPDPYPDQQLFYRSDNATLAELGVPAHTISTSKMDTEKFYHNQDDEIENLDIKNMTAIIKAIAMSSKTIISGTDTPTRVEKQK